MSVSIPLIPPHLSEAYNQFKRWLQFDVEIGNEEQVILASTFSMAANNETFVTLAASHSRIVLIYNQKAFCIDKSPVVEQLFVGMARGSPRVIFDRAGFFLYSEPKESDIPNPWVNDMDPYFEQYHPTRKMFLG